MAQVPTGVCDCGWDQSTATDFGDGGGHSVHDLVLATVTVTQRDRRAQCCACDRENASILRRVSRQDAPGARTVGPPVALRHPIGRITARQRRADTARVAFGRRRPWASVPGVRPDRWRSSELLRLVPNQYDAIVGWARESCNSLDAALGEAYGADVVVAVAAIEGETTEVTSAPPSNGRFEIGSITATITATLVMVAVEDGRMSLDDEIGTWLDAGDNGAITIGEVLTRTHTSGFPRLAPNHEATRVDRANPYAGFTADAAEEGPRASRRATPTTFEYSNFGY